MKHVLITVSLLLNIRLVRSLKLSHILLLNVFTSIYSNSVATSNYVTTTRSTRTGTGLNLEFNDKSKMTVSSDRVIRKLNMTPDK